MEYEDLAMTETKSTSLGRLQLLAYTRPVCRVALTKEWGTDYRHCAQFKLIIPTFTYGCDQRHEAA